MYASKRGGKNRTSLAGEQTPPSDPAPRREISLGLLQEKDPDTANHSIGVSILSIEVARQLNLPRGSARGPAVRPPGCTTSARLGIPNAILDKPGALDEDEIRIVKTHPIVGAELLKSWGLPGPAAIVHEHHERIDGGGYPQGLCAATRSASRLASSTSPTRITAMTRDRPYAKAMSRDDAVHRAGPSRGAASSTRDVVTALIAV